MQLHQLLHLLRFCIIVKKKKLLHTSMRVPLSCFKPCFRCFLRYSHITHIFSGTIQCLNYQICIPSCSTHIIPSFTQLYSSEWEYIEGVFSGSFSGYLRMQMVYSESHLCSCYWNWKMQASDFFSDTKLTILTETDN